MASIGLESMLMMSALAGIGVVTLTAMRSAMRRQPRRRRRRDEGPSRIKPDVAIDSAAATAALVQRITGPGSGPYSGTPFPPIHEDRGATAAGGLSEGVDHERGIIDYSRHVASIGRR